MLVLSCDAKGIMVRPGELRPRARRLAAKAVPKQDGRLSRGEVRNRKRMAEVAAVFDVTPVPRTPAGIMGPGPRPPGPKTAGKWLTASVAADAAEVVAAAFAEAGRRDPGCQRTWIALADGNKDQIAWIQDQAAARGTAITIICDFIHVLEYLRDAAWSFFPEASPDAGPWVRDRAAAILDGHALQVAAALRDAAASLPAAKHKMAAKTARYLETKARWLDYPPSAGRRVAHLHRRHRRRLPSPGQGPHGYHRRPLGSRHRRSHPQTPRPPSQRRLQRLLGLPPPTRTPAQPPAQLHPRRLTLTPKETHPWNIGAVLPRRLLLLRWL